MFVFRPLPRGDLSALLLLSNIPSSMSQGTLLPEEQIKSHHLRASRTYRVYLPPSYDRSSKRRYPVLYLHDGQNVFSSAGTNCCFGWGNWDLDQTVDALAAAKKMREIIMVAVDNGPSRYQEYRGPTAASDRQKLSRPRRGTEGATVTLRANRSSSPSSLIGTMGRQIQPNWQRRTGSL